MEHQIGSDFYNISNSAFIIFRRSYDGELKETEFMAVQSPAPVKTKREQEPQWRTILELVYSY
jgi:hypothetical protein